MHHILFQLNPEYLGMAPFTPVIHQSMDIKARDLGLKANPTALSMFTCFLIYRVSSAPIPLEY